MTSRRFALLLGILLLLMGVAGFVPALVRPADDVHGLSLDGGTPLLFGWFGARALNNVVRIALGAAALVSARSMDEAVRGCRRAAGAFLLLAICGVVPGLDTMFGFMSLYGNDIWLHGLLFLLCLYYGWIHHNPAPPQAPESSTQPL
jgi:hypothetical protein